MKYLSVLESQTLDVECVVLRKNFLNGLEEELFRWRDFTAINSRERAKRFRSRIVKCFRSLKFHPVQICC